MKKFETIKEFMNYSSKCIFCDSPNSVIIMPHSLRLAKSLSSGVKNAKISGQPPYRTEKSIEPFGLSFIYNSKIEEDKIIFSCTEKFYLDKHPPQTYEVMSIDINTSDVSLKDKVEVGILNLFVRIDFKFACVCSNCMGHVYTSTGILAGAKSKKLMPFLLKEECLVQKQPQNDDDIIYTLRSDYFAQQSFLTKEAGPSDYVNTKWGMVTNALAANEPSTQLPLIDLSNIKSKESFQSRVESYVTFS